MPDTTTPATTTTVVGTAAKVAVLTKIETFFKDIGKDVVIDFDDVKADIEALFTKHVKPATTTASATPAAPTPPAAQTPPATVPVAPTAS